MLPGDALKIYHGTAIVFHPIAYRGRVMEAFFERLL